MCSTENLIHRQKSVLDLNNDQIAGLMTAAGQKVSGDMVQKIFSGNAGVTVDKIGAFLQSLRLKVVSADDVVIPAAEHDALRLFAIKGLDRKPGE